MLLEAVSRISLAEEKERLPVQVLLASAVLNSLNSEYNVTAFSAGGIKFAVNLALIVS